MGQPRPRGPLGAGARPPLVRPPTRAGLSRPVPGETNLRLTEPGYSRHSRGFFARFPSSFMSQQHRTATKQARRKRYLKRKKEVTRESRATRTAAKK